MNHNEIKSALDWRYATKRFSADKKIPEADWQVLQEALVKAPSSYGLQPWKFLVVQNPEIREKLKPVSWNQTQVTDASHYVVFLYKEKLDVEHIEKYIHRLVEVRQVSEESVAGYKDMMITNLVKGPRSQTIDVWAQRQSYIAMVFLMETAALLKIDSCPLEGIEPKEYDKILNLEGTGWKTIAAVALGYRHDEDKYQSTPKVRFPAENVVKLIR